MSIVATRAWKCKKCGYEFLAQDPHPCPECQPEEFEKYKREKGLS